MTNTTTTMTALALVRDLYAAFGRGDIPFLLDHIAPDCRWVAPGEGIPNSGTYTGSAGVAEFFEKLAASETILAFEPREFFTNGDDVIAIGYEEVRANSTGRTAATNWAMLFRIREGKVVYWESFYDTSAYLRAHR